MLGSHLEGNENAEFGDSQNKFLTPNAIQRNESHSNISAIIWNTNLKQIKNNRIYTSKKIYITRTHCL
jgi:hypothetical protein